MKKKLAAIVLASAMVCSLAACGGTTTAINDTGSADSENVDQTESTDAAESVGGG